LVENFTAQRYTECRKEVELMLADNLILLRGLKGLTQEQAAEIAGVTRQSYSKWEQGVSHS